jgi:predicted dehydrogenase
MYVSGRNCSPVHKMNISSGVQPRNTLRCAVIGCGDIADLYMQAFRGLPVRVEAACDIEPNHLAKFRSRYRIKRGFASLEELLQGCNLDFTVIATPSTVHASLSNLALDHGVAVVLEKPARLSVAEAKTLADRSAKTAIPIAVMQNYRFKSTVLKALALCQSGEIGKLRRIDCVYHGGEPALQRESWRRQEQTHRLLLYEQAEHFLDLEVAFAGSIRKILSVRTSYRDAEDSARTIEALIEHAGGVTGSIDLRASSGAESARVEIHGSRRRVVLKFFPNGFASYGGLITPLHELWSDWTRSATFGWNVATSGLPSWEISRRALCRARFLERFVNYLQGREARLPVSIGDVLPTIEFLGALEAAVYQPYREEPLVFATLSSRNAC